MKLEFSCNYYIKPLSGGKCAWREEDRYCVLVKWHDFAQYPDDKYLAAALLDNREALVVYGEDDLKLSDLE